VRSCEKSLSGWENYSTTTCQVIRPERYHQINNRNQQLIPRGLGRADGATPIVEVNKLLEVIQKGGDIATEKVNMATLRVG